MSQVGRVQATLLLWGQPLLEKSFRRKIYLAGASQSKEAPVIDTFQPYFTGIQISE